MQKQDLNKKNSKINKLLKENNSQYKIKDFHKEKLIMHVNVPQ